MSIHDDYLRMLAGQQQLFAQMISPQNLQRAYNEAESRHHREWNLYQRQQEIDLNCGYPDRVVQQSNLLLLLEDE